jgi:thiol:disulfide interchange protein DsbD
MSGKPLFLLLIVTGFALSACGSAGDEASPSTSRAENVSVTATHVAASTGNVTILWDFQLADGWHLYAPLRNDSGFPPTIKLTLPDGWIAGPLQWPVPERHLAAGEILDHVYHDELLLLQDLTLPASAEPGRVFGIEARLDWLVCKDLCIPGHDALDLEVTVADTATAKIDRDRVARARTALPVPAPPAGLGLTWHESRVEITVPDAVGLEFYPADDCALLTDVVNDAVSETDRLELNVRARDGRIGPLKGILHQKLAGGRSRNWIIDQPFGG